MRVFVIAVSYDSDSAALRFVRSLAKVVTQDANVSITLVDNTGRSDSTGFFQGIYEANPSVVCLKSRSNLGYFGGARLALQEYLNRNGAEYPDWLLVSNADIEFRDVRFFEHLVGMGDLDDVGVVAPAIWSDLWRCDRNPKLVSRPSKRKMQSYKFLCRNFYVVNVYMLLGWVKSRSKSALKSFELVEKKTGAERPGYPADEDDFQQIYAAQGACFIFAKEYFLRGGSLNYPCFLFGEEVYVAETVRGLGLRIIYNPRLRVYHDDHVSTGLFRTREIASFTYESAVYLADQYFL